MLWDLPWTTTLIFKCSFNLCPFNDIIHCEGDIASRYKDLCWKFEALHSISTVFLTTVVFHCLYLFLKVSLGLL